VKTKPKAEKPTPETPKPETPTAETTEKRRFCGKKGRSGPPLGSCNAIRHGLKAGQLPKDAKYIEWRLNAFRRTLEAAVLAKKNEVTITDAAFIQTAIRWERHGCLAQRWLRKKYEELKPAELLHFSREIAKASTERDRALAALNLGRNASDDAIAALYALPSPSIPEDKS